MNHGDMWLVLNQKLAAGENLAIKKAFSKGKKKKKSCFKMLASLQIFVVVIVGEWEIN